MICQFKLLFVIFILPCETIKAAHPFFLLNKQINSLNLVIYLCSIWPV